MNNISSVATISAADEFDDNDTIVIDTSQLTSPYVTTTIDTSSITVDTSTPSLIVRDENGEEYDVLRELKEIKQYVKVLEEACDALLENARKDTTIAEMLDKHEFLRKLSE
jgi:hypothetical protein